MSRPSCPVCESPHTIPAAHFDDGRPGRPPVTEFLCLECRSVCAPLAEPHAPQSDVEWHKSVEERNRGYSSRLFDDLGITAPDVLDIGCGTGTLVWAAIARGGRGVGFDTDAASCAYGRDRHGLDLRAEMWTADTELPFRPGLITCIAVLEHIHQPLGLLRELILAGKKYDCPLYVMVPFFTKGWWKYLAEPITDGEFHPFRNPFVHVAHFSPEGFEMAARKFTDGEMVSMTRLNYWPGYLIRP